MRISFFKWVIRGGNVLPLNISKLVDRWKVYSERKSFFYVDELMESLERGKGVVLVWGVFISVSERRNDWEVRE